MKFWTGWKPLEVKEDDKASNEAGTEKKATCPFSGKSSQQPSDTANHVQNNTHEDNKKSL